MTAEQMPARYRVEDFFSHIDMGFLNRRLAISFHRNFISLVATIQQPSDCRHEFTFGQEPIGWWLRSSGAYELTKLDHVACRAGAGQAALF
jgi:hypothetical protein